MTLGPCGGDDRAGDDEAARHDPSIVPGLAEPPAPPGDPVGPGLRRVQPLDLSQDPDRFDADRFDPTQQPVVVGPLDLAQDPDRMPPPGGQSLTDLLGKERSYEEDRDGYEWIFGLLGVLVFLALVAFLFTSVLNP